MVEVNLVPWQTFNKTKGESPLSCNSSDEMQDSNFRTTRLSAAIR